MKEWPLNDVTERLQLVTTFVIQRVHSSVSYGHVTVSLRRKKTTRGFSCVFVKLFICSFICNEKFSRRIKGIRRDTRISETLDSV